MSDDTSDDGPRDPETFAALQAAYRARLGARLAEIASLWRTARAGRPDEAATAELMTQVHRLAGSAPLYGYAAAGEAAAALESALDAWAAGTADAPAIDRLVQDLERAAALD